MAGINNPVQSVFFEEVRKSLPPNVSFVDELAEILMISKDSAYRRIRGETILSLDEVKRLCEKFNLSLDAIMGPSSEFASFRYRLVDKTHLSIGNWLSRILENLVMLQKSPGAELLYFAKDMPVFYYFNSPLLSSFKIFFWMNTVMRHDHDQNLKFSPDRVPKEMTTLASRIYDCYTGIRRIEIWSEETLNVTLKQIEFYYECGFLEDVSVAQRLFDEYLELLNKVRGWAAAGYKDSGGSSFELYKNDLLIADNTILFRMGERRIVFIPYNTFNILSTTNQIFCSETDEYLSNLISKSQKISTTGERQRQIFFNHMEEKIRKSRNRLQ